jgi:UDP-N-acetylglucosamine enolpyruvyl transferase
MSAAIPTEDEVMLESIPQVRDIETERKLLVSTGAEMELGYSRTQHRTTIMLALALRSNREIRDRQDHARFLARSRTPRRALRPARSGIVQSTCT